MESARIGGASVPISSAETSTDDTQIGVNVWGGPTGTFAGQRARATFDNLRVTADAISC